MDALTAKLRRRTAALRRYCRPPYPVTVKRATLGHGHNGDWGDCTFIGDRFVIRVEASLRDPGLTFVLCHEWAHALCWTAEHPGWGDHPPEWGVAYARCWRAIHEETV